MRSISTVLRKYLRDPLYKNSFFLVLSRVINVAFGFFFWMIAARLYSVKDIGLATTLISSLGLVILFSRFGFDFSLIRFLPLNDKSKIFNTCLIITTISSLIIGIIYISGVSFFSSNLSFLQTPVYAIVFLAIAVLNSISLTTGTALIAIRKGQHYFFQNLFFALRIPLLFALIFLGYFGIFGSVGLAYLFVALSAVLLLSRFIGFEFKVDRQFIKESLKFSSGNYIANLLLAAPLLILPIMVLNLLGELEAAKYFIAFAIGSLVLIIPDAISNSLFVEGSHGESLRRNGIKASVAVYALLIPAAILIYSFGTLLLGLFGTDYVEAVELLELLVLSSFLVPIYTLFISIQNVRMKVESLVKLNFARFLLLLGLSYVFTLEFGIVGIGYAWIITYGILGLGIGGLVRRKGWA